MKTICAAAIVLLSGCGYNQFVANRDNAYCQSIGTEHGSDGYANCRIWRVENRQRALNDLISIDQTERALRQKRSVTCNTFGNTTTCY